MTVLRIGCYWWWCVTLEVDTHFHSSVSISPAADDCPTFNPTHVYWRITWSIPPLVRVQSKIRTDRFFFFFHSPPTVDDDEMRPPSSLPPPAANRYNTLYPLSAIAARWTCSRAHICYSPAILQVRSVGCCPLFSLYLNRHVLLCEFLFPSTLVLPPKQMIYDGGGRQ